MTDSKATSERDRRPDPADLVVDNSATVGEIDLTRYGLGQAGLSDKPMFEAHVEQLAQLRPQTIRLFVQDYYDIYQSHGLYHWDTLDRALASIVATGARPFLSLCLKPRILFPAPGQDSVHPTSYEEWEELVSQIVRHTNGVRNYGVRYWEIGNEPDLGEEGGCPFRFQPQDYLTFYTRTCSAILRADPEARVGGPALADHRSPIGGALLDFASGGGAPLDFFSWHHFDSDPAGVRDSVAAVKSQVSQYPSLEGIELIINEWNMSLAKPDPRPGFQAAFVLDATRAMYEEGLSRAAYFHIRDFFVDAASFNRFLSAEGAVELAQNWNVAPQYCGIFDNQGRTRPTYYVFRLLSLMKGAEHSVVTGHPGVRALAATSGRHTHIIYWAFPDGDASGPVDIAVRFATQPSGTYRFVRLNPNANVNNLETLRSGDAAELADRPLTDTLEPYGIRWIHITQP